MSIDLILFIGGGFLAAMAAGLSGFAFALVASAVWLHLLPPTEAVPLIVASGLAIHVLSMVQLRSIIDVKRLWPFLIGGVLGVPLGVLVLKHVDPQGFRLSIGVLMIAYAGFMLLRRRTQPKVTAGGRGADGLVGLAGGVLGGAAGLSGILPTLWCDLRGWPKDDQRGVYQPFILAMHSLTVVTLATTGLFSIKVGSMFLVALPGLLLGAWLGVKLYRATTAAQFRTVLLALVLVSGVALVA
ncbi:MAG TPA: sulfite exporter TauE/SafE family protein [Azospirillaceae bacterium]|nr:sulfite exporter TauE/SafE family protein [Azospirillaceae bacterium]